MTNLRPQSSRNNIFELIARIGARRPRYADLMCFRVNYNNGPGCNSRSRMEQEDDQG